MERDTLHFVIFCTNRF